MPTNVLFPCGERQTVRLVPVHVDRSANDAPWHEPKVGLGAGKNPVERSTTGDGAAQRLTFAHHNVRTVVAWRFDHAQGYGLNTDNQRRVFTDDLLNANKILVKYTERIGLFKVDTARTRCFGQRFKVQ